MVGSVVLEVKKVGTTLHLDTCVYSHTYFPFLSLIQNTKALGNVLTNHIYASYEANKCLSCWETSTCIILFLTVIRMGRATGALTVVSKEVKDPALQKSRFLLEWENEGKPVTMVIEVAIVAVFMATKKNCYTEVHSRSRTEMPIFRYRIRGLFEDLDVLPSSSFYLSCFWLG